MQACSCVNIVKVCCFCSTLQWHFPCNIHVDSLPCTCTHTVSAMQKHNVIHVCNMYVFLPCGKSTLIDSVVEHVHMYIHVHVYQD